MNKNSLRIGQKVFSIKYGWGEVIQSGDNPVTINFNGANVYSYEFMNGKAIPYDIDYTELEMKGYTHSELCDVFKNDLMTEEEKETYDRLMKAQIGSTGNFIM